MKSKKNEMEKMDIKKLAIKTSLPMVVSMISISLYNIVDTIFVSNISENALTAISLAAPIQSIITAIAIGIGIGVNSLLARTLGEKNDEKVKKVIINGILLTFINWIIIAIVSAIGMKSFFRIFTKNATLISLGSSYLYIISILSVGTLFQILFEKILEAYGKTKQSMIIQIVGSVINLILDPILIYGLFGVKALGIVGAGIATVIGQITGMFIGLYYVIKLGSLKGEKEIKLNKEIVIQTYKVGFPTMVLESVASLINMFVNRILIGFSDLAVAVWGVYVKVQQFIFIIVYGLNYGMMPIVGYNYGAKRYDRIFEAIKYFLKLATVVTLVGTIVFVVFPSQIFTAFGVSEETKQIGIVAFRILAIGFVFAGISMVLSANFQSLGNGTYSLLINLSRKLIFVVPIIFIFKGIFGMNAIWWSFTIAEIITMIITIVIFRSKFLTKLKLEDQKEKIKS